MTGRRTLSLLAAGVLAAATACMPASEPRVTNLPEAGQVLDARIFPPHYGQLPIHLNAPAYVALFEIVPGRGASLLYPQSGSGFVQVAELWVPLEYNAQRWLYANNRYSSFGGYMDYRGAYGSGSFHPQQGAPRYLFLIASESPLAIEQFQGSVGEVRDYLGHAQFTSMSADRTMEALAMAVLPGMGYDAWISDVYVDWGYDWGSGAGLGTTAAYTTMQAVRCADGSVAFAPWTSGWGFEYLPCTPLQWVAPPGNPVYPGQPPVPGDSAAPPPSGEERRRAGVRTDGGRDRVPAPGATGARQSDAEIRATMNALIEDGRRARAADRYTEQLRNEVDMRRRADARDGASAAGRAPGATADRPATSVRPAPSPSARPTRADAERPDPRRRLDDAERAGAGESRTVRSQAVQREQAQRAAEQRAQREAAEQRANAARAEAERQRAAARREQAARDADRRPAPRPDTQRERAPESRPEPQPESRPSPPPPRAEPEPSSGGGRSRVPPPAL